MTQHNILDGEILDELTLTLEEIASCCAVAPQWIVERVEAGIISCRQSGERWCFVSADLIRVRQLVAIERDFDANPELAALVADLIEEVRRLKVQLKADTSF